jgi:hypothetical protein
VFVHELSGPQRMKFHSDVKAQVTAKLGKHVLISGLKVIQNVVDPESEEVEYEVIGFAGDKTARLWRVARARNNGSSYQTVHVDKKVRNAIVEKALSDFHKKEFAPIEDVPALVEGYWRKREPEVQTSNRFNPIVGSSTRM